MPNANSPSADFDLDKAIADPEAMFHEPEAVVTDQRLTKEQKIEVLESWRTDAERLQESTAENMGGGEESHLRRVDLALERVREALD